ncbi:MAG: hypothetical protein WBB25_12455 [Sulfitobacter sp.]
MLKTMTKGACALAAAMTFVSTAAHADNHMIEIVDGAFLPIVSYVNRGDNLIFTNGSDFEHTISDPDGNWTSGPIAPGGRYVLNINNQMAMTFNAVGAGGEPMVGEYSYEEAPLEE